MLISQRNGDRNVHAYLASGEQVQCKQMNKNEANECQVITGVMSVGEKQIGPVYVGKQVRCSQEPQV